MNVDSPDLRANPAHPAKLKGRGGGCCTPSPSSLCVAAVLLVVLAGAGGPARTPANPPARPGVPQGPPAGSGDRSGAAPLVRGRGHASAGAGQEPQPQPQPQPQPCYDDPALPVSVRQLCPAMQGHMWAEARAFFTARGRPLKIAVVNLEAQVRRGSGHLAQTKCGKYFNNSLQGLGAGRTRDYSYKFAAELLLPLGLRRSPYFTEDAAAADWVVLELCIIGRTWQGQILNDVPGMLGASPRAQPLWHNGSGRAAGRLLITLVGDHGPCIQSNEKAGQLKKRAWTSDAVGPLGMLMNEGSRQGGCYNPAKDLTVPTSAIVLGRPRRACADPSARAAGQPPRPNLAFFSGKKDSEVRRELYKQLQGSPGLLFPDSLGEAAYSCALQASVFCIAARGNAAWSPRLDEAIHAGCIPVLLADNYDPPFSHVLDYTRFSVSIPEDEVERLPEILRAVPAARVRAMQGIIRRLRPVFRYSSALHNHTYGEDAIPLIAFELWLKSKGKWPVASWAHSNTTVQ